MSGNKERPLSKLPNWVNTCCPDCDTVWKVSLTMLDITMRSFIGKCPTCNNIGYYRIELNMNWGEFINGKKGTMPMWEASRS